jgi:hypothetical protein
MKNPAQFKSVLASLDDRCDGAAGAQYLPHPHAISLAGSGSLQRRSGQVCSL